jgi:hypothetical protein
MLFLYKVADPSHEHDITNRVICEVAKVGYSLGKQIRK